MTTGNEEAIFDCITQEAKRQRVKHAEQIDLINAAERKTRSLVKNGKLEENLMLVEFTINIQKLWNPN
jgi:hypothetical protein